jgi:hypothetical protein
MYLRNAAFLVPAVTIQLPKRREREGAEGKVLDREGGFDEICFEVCSSNTNVNAFFFKATL